MYAFSYILQILRPTKKYTSPSIAHGTFTKVDRLLNQNKNQIAKAKDRHYSLTSSSKLEINYEIVANKTKQLEKLLFSSRASENKENIKTKIIE